MRKSELLQAVWDELLKRGLDEADLFEAVQDEADSSCTLHHDNDGSTGFEIFENGFNLAVKAAGRPVWYFEVEVVDTSDCALFFIGTEQEAEAKMRRRYDELEEV